MKTSEPKSNLVPRFAREAVFGLSLFVAIAFAGCASKNEAAGPAAASKVADSAQVAAEKKTVGAVPGASGELEEGGPAAVEEAPQDEAQGQTSEAPKEPEFDPSAELTVLRWHGDGPIKEKGQMALNDEGQEVKTGPWAMWRQNGQMWGLEEYQNGLKHGKCTYWYESGQKESDREYWADKRHGEWTQWYEDGQIEFKKGFLKGQRHGKWQVWHPSGQLAYEGEYDHGLKIGVWKYFDESGELIKKEEF